MSGKRAAIGAALFVRAPLLLSRPACRRGVALGDRLLDILQRQKQLVGIELLRAPAELGAAAAGEADGAADRFARARGRARRYALAIAASRSVNAAITSACSCFDVVGKLMVRSRPCTALESDSRDWPVAQSATH